MTKTVFALALSVLACSAVAETGTPTLADAPKSVLATQAQAQPAAANAAQEQAASPCETAREVRLGRFQARRLERQADRQEAKAACECCKCDCCKKKDCRPTALVVTKSCQKCACNCK